MARGRWFRQYENTMDNPSVQMLSDWHYRAWHTLLCFASKNGGEFTDDASTLSFILRKSPGKVRDTMQVLLSARLFEKTPQGFKPRNWDEFQYKSDSPNQRVKDHRARKCNVTEGVTETLEVTPPEADTETEVDTESKKESAPAVADASKPPSVRATRWPSDREVPAEWHSRALAKFADLGREPPDLRLEAAKFVNYWSSKSGRDATKTDWEKTFLNWCLNARTTDQRSFADRKFASLKAGASKSAFVDERPGQGVEDTRSNLVRLAISSKP